MIEIKVDAQAALTWFNRLQVDQLPFAISKGLNAVGTDAQASVQAGLKDHFKLRRVQWNLRGIKIRKFSTKTDHSLIIQVSEGTNYLNKFETGGDKVPVGGRHYLWEPNDNFFKGRIIQGGDPLRPKNLHLHRDQGGRIIGDSRTFMVKPKTGSGDPLILQRKDRGLTSTSKKRLKGLTLDNVGKKNKTISRTGGTVLLYILRKRIPVRATLEFVPTVKATVASRYRERMNEAMTYAIRSRK